MTYIPSEQSIYISILKEMFINRSDTFSIQNPNSSYTRLDEEITDEVIMEHLRGSRTIGSYQFNKNDKCKWVCFDFDGKSLEEQLQNAKLLYLKLRDDEKVESILLEFSGKKGYHLWVFIEEADGASAKVWAEEVSNNMGVHEIFPKQMTTKDKFGNLVKLPLGVHQVSGKKSVLFDNNCKELSWEDSFKRLEEIYKIPKLKVPKVIVREVVRTITIQRGKGEIPSFIQNLIKEGVGSGERHKYRFIIIKELYNLGYSDEEIKAETFTFNKNCNPPEDELIVDIHLNKLLEYPDRYLAKEIVEDMITSEELAKASNISYDMVIETYKKWLYLEEESIIDVCLAVALGRKEPTPLWVIMVAPSGSGKTEIVRALEDNNKPSTTETMSKITKNTFLCGLKDEPDFAEILRNNPKLFLTYGFAQFVKLNSEEKAQIWAQLRDIYDGYIERKAAGGVKKKVDNIKINWLICTTPVVDSELLIQQELGTRELIFRFKHEKVKEDDLMERIWNNIECTQQMRKELQFIVRKFIEKKESEGLKEVKISPEIKKKLMLTSQMIACLRASTESDNYTGELTNFVYKEMPTRILKQLITLFKLLKNLDDNYSDEKAINVITRVALSSIHPIRLRIILEIMKHENISTTAIQKALSIGWKTVNTQLYTARQLNLVNFYEDQYEVEEGNKAWKKKLWTLNNNNSVINYIKELDDIKEMIDYYYKSE